MHAGKRILWSAVLKINLARCGTAMPTNANGPQNAVILPDNILVDIKIRIRVSLILTPILRE
jgi:hypothetical protein